MQRSPHVAPHLGVGQQSSSVFTLGVDDRCEHVQERVGLNKGYLGHRLPRLTLAVRVGGKVLGIELDQRTGGVRHELPQGFGQQHGTLGWQDAEQLSQTGEGLRHVEVKSLELLLFLSGVELLQIDHVSDERCVEVEEVPVPRPASVVVIVEDPVQSLDIFPHHLTSR